VPLSISPNSSSFEQWTSVDLKDKASVSVSQVKETLNEAKLPVQAVEEPVTIKEEEEAVI